MDYKFIYLAQKNNFIQPNKPKKEFLMMKSITKLLVIITILYLHKKNKIDIYSGLKFLENNKITPINIINHTAGFEDDWFILKNDKYIVSKLAQKYFKSKNIYEFAINLKSKYKLGKFKYNNYAYDILGYLIYKQSGLYVDQFLKKNILKNIKFKWEKNKGIPYCSFGLHIYAPDMKKFTKNIHDASKKVNLIYFFEKYYKAGHVSVNIDGLKFYGHSGSGGQYLYLNKKIVFGRFDYGDPDKLPVDEIYKKENLVKWVKKTLVDNNKSYFMYLKYKNQLEILKLKKN